VFHSPHEGPIFGGNSLAIREQPFNKPNAAKCYTESSDFSGYDIGCDNFGNNRITGDGANEPTYKKTFTVAEIEIFLIDLQ
jgi:hypothetical protein